MSLAYENANRRREIELRLLMGLQPFEIAHELGLKIATVKSHIRKIRESWSRVTNRGKPEWMPETIAHIGELQRQAWLGWKRSLDFLAKSTRTTKELVSGTQEQTSIGRAEHLADTRCLVVVLHCLKMRNDLLGLDESALQRAFTLPDLPGLDELIAKLPKEQLDQISESGKVVEGLIRQLGVDLPENDSAA